MRSPGHAAGVPGTALPGGFQQFNCIVNTVLSLLGATVVTFVASAAVHNKFDMARPSLLIRNAIVSAMQSFALELTHLCHLQHSSRCSARFLPCFDLTLKLQHRRQHSAGFPTCSEPNLTPYGCLHASMLPPSAGSVRES